VHAHVVFFIILISILIFSLFFQTCVDSEWGGGKKRIEHGHRSWCEFMVEGVRSEFNICLHGFVLQIIIKLDSGNVVNCRLHVG